MGHCKLIFYSMQKHKNFVKITISFTERCLELNIAPCLNITITLTCQVLNVASEWGTVCER